MQLLTESVVNHYLHYREGGEFKSNERADDGVLTIYGATADNSGLFVCIGTNEYGTTRAEAYIQVQSGIIFSRGPKTVEASVGESVTLDCEVISHCSRQINMSHPSLVDE